MIKANDFRVGSLYLHNDTEGYFKEGMIVQDREDWHPLPITPEWLERMSFVEETPEGSPHRLWRHLNHSMRYDDRGFSYYVDGTYELVPDCKYVHQIQNLYMDLTGDEIMFTPSSNHSTFASGTQ